jgi:hypothetical protein
LLTRSIDIDPFELTIEEKIYRGAKRLCIASAIAAVMLSALDLADIRSLQSAAEFFHLNRQRIAEMPDVLRTGIHSIELAWPSPSAHAMIPRDVTVSAEPAPVIMKPTLIDDLADTRELDAVQFAMQPPPSWKNAEVPIAAVPPIAVPPPAELVFASADPAPLNLPPVTPVSLPMASPIPLGMVPMPRAAPGAPPPSPAERLHLEGAERTKAEHCLSNAIYFEARDQPYQGQVAVAQVVINRVFSGVYPHDVCGVIYQNASHHLACQFTFACDGKRKTINEFGSWARARRIARETLDGQLYVPAVSTATHYHAAYVHPYWVREMHRYAREGIHLFYRPIAWGNGSDEPVWSRIQLDANKKVAANKK